MRQIVTHRVEYLDLGKMHCSILTHALAAIKDSFLSSSQKRQAHIISYIFDVSAV